MPVTTAHAAAITAAILVPLFSGSVVGQALVDAPDRAGAIREAERALADAMHSKDRPRLDLLLAPDYVLRGAPDIDRATWIQNAVTLCWGDRSDIDAFRTSQHGWVIVASFELTFYVDPATCRPAVSRSLVTDVWVRDAGGWRLQIRHAGPPPRADASIAAQYGAVPLPAPNWELSSELSLVATGGNTSTRTVGLGGSATHRIGRATTRASVAFLTSETDSVTKARSLTAQARHGIRAGTRIELFGEGVYSRDRFAGLNDRATTAVGAAYTVSSSRRHLLTSEGSIGFTAEQHSDSTHLRFVTTTGALRYRWTIVPGTELIEDIRLIADLQTTDNWRSTSITALSVTLTRLLSLKASHAIEHRNAPVAGFVRTDMRTSAALVFSLQRRRTVR